MASCFAHRPAAVSLRMNNTTAGAASRKQGDDEDFRSQLAEFMFGHAVLHTAVFSLLW